MVAEQPKQGRGELLKHFGLAALSSALLAYIIIPSFIRCRCPGQLTACKSNLKNIGTAMEMYSTDYNGQYPRNLALLTPNYLKTLPECPTAECVSYRADFGPTAAYNTPGFEDYYFVECSGASHTAVAAPSGYPQYDGISGLIER